MKTDSYSRYCCGSYVKTTGRAQPWRASGYQGTNQSSGVQSSSCHVSPLSGLYLQLSPGKQEPGLCNADKHDPDSHLKEAKQPQGLTWAGQEAEGFGRSVYFSLYLTFHYICQATPSECRNLPPALGTFPYKLKRRTDDKNEDVLSSSPCCIIHTICVVPPFLILNYFDYTVQAA